MDFNLQEEDIAFRDEVRSFIKENLPPEIAASYGRGYHPRKQDILGWQAILHKRGWSVPHWPVEYGGTGWTPIQQFIFNDECEGADAPPPCLQGTRLVGPLIYTFGSEEQKAKYLPPIASGETYWCQGFSEPGAGSDLTSLQTRAVRDGDEYVVNGHKIWTTEAHFSDRMFCLLRTSAAARPQEGISFLLLDMRDPGITVSPIKTLDSNSTHSLNEVFIENVRVPANDLVGEEGKAWGYAKFVLEHERVMSSLIHHIKRAFRRMMDLAKVVRSSGSAFIDLLEFRLRAARLAIDLRALEWGVLRMLSGDVPDPATAASALKLAGSFLHQDVLGLAIDVLGPDAVAYYPEPGDIGVDPLGWFPDDAPGLMAQFLYRRASTIYSGTSEIQRSIIYKQLSRR